MDAHAAEVSAVRLFEGANLPHPDDFDWLILMGGTMSVNQESDHPWLRAEKRLIVEATERRKVVLGICLGAQLIASALGARVFSNNQKEIGWFPVRRTPGNLSAALGGLFTESPEVFHWHGETFDIPHGAVNFLESDACANQAFLLGRRVLGLQFHLEITLAGAVSLIQNSRHEMAPGVTVQTESAILCRSERFTAINRLMGSVLKFLSGEA
jgi:GMP synthase-like glutamine amidotransferase